MSATDLYRSIPGSLWAILTDWLSIDRRRSPSGALWCVVIMITKVGEGSVVCRRGATGLCRIVLSGMSARQQGMRSIQLASLLPIGRFSSIAARCPGTPAHRSPPTTSSDSPRRLAMHAPQPFFLICLPACRVFSAEVGCRKFEVSTSACQKFLQWYWLALSAGDPRLGSYGCAAVSSNEKWSKILQTVINASFFVDNCGARAVATGNISVVTGPRSRSVRRGATPRRTAIRRAGFVRALELPEGSGSSTIRLLVVSLSRPAGHSSVLPPRGRPGRSAPALGGGSGIFAHHACNMFVTWRSVATSTGWQDTAAGDGASLPGRKQVALEPMHRRRMEGWNVCSLLLVVS